MSGISSYHRTEFLPVILDNSRALGSDDQGLTIVSRNIFVDGRLLNTYCGLLIEPVMRCAIALHRLDQSTYHWPT